MWKEIIKTSDPFRVLNDEHRLGAITVEQLKEGKYQKWDIPDGITEPDAIGFIIDGIKIMVSSDYKVFSFYVDYEGIYGVKEKLVDNFSK
tara:strand:+ start:360 stop:629 length:270 start_codon:yes stop_codon:yes gene_type:complete